MRAIVGGRDYGQSQFNRATDALRQPGSSFKPFVYTAALTDEPEAAADLDRRRRADLPRQLVPAELRPLLLRQHAAGLGAGPLDQLDPGPDVPARSARATPRPAARMIIDTARKMGLTHPLADSSSLPIGAAEVTVIDMTASYAVFANGGKRADALRRLGSAATRRRLIYRHDTRHAAGAGAADARVVHDMNFMLNKVVEEGTGKRAMLAGIRAAGKTGTTNAYRDAWFVGFTGNLVAGVWFGNDDHSRDEQHDRRHASRDDLAGGHGVRAPEPRDPADSRPRTRDCAKGRSDGSCWRTAGCAAGLSRRNLVATLL